MSNGLERLKRDYRAIDAPPFLATRVRATVARRPARARRWMPAAATAFVAIAAIGLLPIMLQRPVDAPLSVKAPSFTSLATLAPNETMFSTPSLTHVRTVSMPSMPTKPAPKPATKPQQPQTYFDSQHVTLEETPDAHS